MAKGLRASVNTEAVKSTTNVSTREKVSESENKERNRFALSRPVKRLKLKLVSVSKVERSQQGSAVDNGMHAFLGLRLILASASA